MMTGTHYHHYRKIYVTNATIKSTKWSVSISSIFICVQKTYMYLRSLYIPRKFCYFCTNYLPVILLNILKPRSICICLKVDAFFLDHWHYICLFTLDWLQFHTLNMALNDYYRFDIMFHWYWYAQTCNLVVDIG